jgi:HIV Tat-specific factor 1
VPQLASVFSKAGVLLIGDDGEPRIKLYNDADGKFKGEALVIYFKEGSVSLAVTLLDDTELEMGAGVGNMRVKEAEYGDGWPGDKKSGTDGAEKDKPKEAGADGEAKDGAATVVPGTGAAKRTYTAEEKQKMTKRIKMMQK